MAAQGDLEDNPFEEQKQEVKNSLANPTSNEFSRAEADFEDD